MRNKTVFLHPRTDNPSRIPSIIWWPGKIRFYESIYSFKKQFCLLNGISGKQYDEYFHTCFSQRDLPNYKKFAALANEHELAIASMFGPVTDLFCIERPQIYSGRSGHPKSIRYCPRCIQFGYHSYLHNISWVKRCPFHLNILKETHEDNFVELMERNCIDWPRNSECDAALMTAEHNGYVQLILQWLKNVSPKMATLAKSEIWKIGDYERCDPEQIDIVFGHLCSIEKLPDVLDEIVIKPRQWISVEKELSKMESNALLELLQRHGIDLLYRYFKVASAHSSKPAKFVESYEAFQSQLTAAHEHAHCEWQQAAAGTRQYWVRRNSASFSSSECPYDFVSKMLQINWGKAELVLSGKNKTNYRCEFLYLTTFLRNEGFFKHISGSDLSGDGALAFDWELLSNCVWRRGPIFKVLNYIAEFELALEFSVLTNWLENIESGIAPNQAFQTFGSVCLLSVGEKIILIRRMTV